jgi:hypothetical protein
MPHAMDPRSKETELVNTGSVAALAQRFRVATYSLCGGVSFGGRIALHYAARRDFAGVPG